MPSRSHPFHRLLSASAIGLAVAGLSACSSMRQNPLHVSFEELGYAGSDVGSNGIPYITGSTGSAKYRSVVNIAGLAPPAAVGSLNNRPQRYSRHNPIGWFASNNGLPDYYSAAITPECSKVFEVVYDDGVTADDVWSVREELQNVVGDIGLAHSQRVQYMTAQALHQLWQKTVAELPTTAPPKPADDIAARDERMARTLALRALDVPDNDQGLAPLAESSGAKLLSGDEVAALMSFPAVTDWAAYRAAVTRLGTGTAAILAKMNNPAPDRLDAKALQLSKTLASAQRKGIVVTRWTANNNIAQSGRIGTLAQGSKNDSNGRSGYLVMGGIRLAQILLGDDFLTYHQKVRHQHESELTGIDSAVRDQFLVTYTVGAKYRAFFEETQADRFSQMQLSVDLSKLTSAAGGPVNGILMGLVDEIKKSALEYQRVVASTLSTGEQGFLPQPRVRLYEFRFGHDKPFEASMQAEKLRSALHPAVYSVRGDVVQNDTRLLTGNLRPPQPNCTQPIDPYRVFAQITAEDPVASKLISVVPPMVEEQGVSGPTMATNSGFKAP